MPSKFTANKIFADESINSLFDRMYYEIEKAVPGATLSTCFCLSGKAGALLQEPGLAKCSNIVFAVDDEAVFEFINAGLGKKMKASGSVRLDGRALIYFPNLHLEIWKWDKPYLIKIIVVDGIDVHDIEQIPFETI